MLIYILGSRGSGAAANIFRKISTDAAKKNALGSIFSRTDPKLPTLRVLSPTRSFVSATRAVLEKHTMKVPTMGDSITEGTIVEWTAHIGQKVEEEDVLALIETDKVTVDIKAAKAGVLTKQFGAIDDTVEVGSDLCEIDSEAVPTVEATEVVGAAPEAETSAPSLAPVESSSTPAVSSSGSSEARTPSIHFLGKEGWAKKLNVEAEYVISANYGRLLFSEEEMEALLMGGANLAPEIKEYSSGAVFSN